MCHAQGVGADPHMALALPPVSKVAKEEPETPSFQYLDEEMSIRIGRAGLLSGKPPFIYPQLQQSDSKYAQLKVNVPTLKVNYMH